MNLYDIISAENMTFYNTSILPENMHHIGIGDIIKLKVGKLINNETEIYCRVDSKTNTTITVTDLLGEIINDKLYIFKINPSQHIEPRKKTYARRNINIIKKTESLDNITIENRVDFMFTYLYHGLGDSITFNDIINLSDFLDINLIYDVDRGELSEAMSVLGNSEQIHHEFDFTTNPMSNINQCVCGLFFNMEEIEYKDELREQYKDSINNTISSNLDVLSDEYNDSLCDCCYEEKLIDECDI